MTFIVPGSDRPRPGLNRATRMIDNSIHTGIVHEELSSGNTGETQYVVMVTVNGQDVPVTCKRMSRWGGVHNYEEYTLRGYQDVIGTGTNINYSQRPGDVVIVAFLDGIAKQGIILGGIRHGARTEAVPGGGPAYKSRFNGIEKEITSSGALKYTYKGIVPSPQLEFPPTGAQIAEAIDNPLGGASFGFNESGSFNIDDGSDQSILLKKDSFVGGTMYIKSGSTQITITGNFIEPIIDLKTTGTINLDAGADVAIKGLSMGLTSTTRLDMEATAGVSITSAGSELLDLIVTLIDEIGGLTISSPVGPCSPIMGSPTWAKILAIQVKLKLMMG
jgi:hypothetical protein